jgi:hypothetical protein
MSDISKLYEEVMSGTEVEKTASDMNADGGPVFDRNFFEKVASGDEDAVGTLSEFIAEAQAEGHSDEEIEEAIAEAMADVGVEDAGVEDAGDSEFELRKAAAYAEGAEKAFADSLTSRLAKTAGVTADDLLEYELGQAYGVGYAEARQAIDAAIEKIAEAKQAALVDFKNIGRAAMGSLKRLPGKAKAAPGAVHGYTGEKAEQLAHLLRSRKGQAAVLKDPKALETGRTTMGRVLQGAGYAGAGLGVAGGGAAAVKSRNRN